MGAELPRRPRGGRARSCALASTPGTWPNGVTLVDPGATYIDVDVEIGADSVIYPNTFLERGSRDRHGVRHRTVGRDGRVEVGDGRSCGSRCSKGARVGRGCEVGPFARLRDGGGARRRRAGRQLRRGQGLDARPGREGQAPRPTSATPRSATARTSGPAPCTVNYDGYAKHATKVGAGARIGSDTMLVAPVTVGP